MNFWEHYIRYGYRWESPRPTCTISIRLGKLLKPVTGNWDLNHIKSLDLEMVIAYLDYHGNAFDFEEIPDGTDTIDKIIEFVLPYVLAEAIKS